MSQIIDRLPLSQPAPAPQEKPNEAWEFIKKVLTPIASLRLTVALFALSILLVLFGTVAQARMGINSAMQAYFRSLFVEVPWQLFVHFGQIFFGVSKDAYVGGTFPFFGGWLLGGAMLVNLLAAHLVRFKFTWKRSGILLIHAGLVIMMLSELITGLLAVESRMSIAEGETVNYIQVWDKQEIVFINRADPKVDDVVAIPHSQLKVSKERITSDDLPVDVEILEVMKNSRLYPPAAADSPSEPVFTTSSGQRFIIKPADPEPGTSDKSDVPSVRIRLLKKGTDTVLKETVVSLYFDWNSMRRDPEFRFVPQQITVDDKTYTFELRPKRIYKPYSIYLTKFHHKTYVGQPNMAKDFSSDIVLHDASTGHRREVKISMNDPLRYDGETFYQQAVLANDSGTVLQVVRNPGWLLPYISCFVVTLGMLIHFGMNLNNFLTLKMAKRPNVPPPGLITGNLSRDVSINWPLIVPCIVVGIASIVILVALSSPAPTKGELSLDEVRSIPVVDSGRIKPLDTLARNSLVIITKKQSFKDKDGETRPAIQWLLDLTLFIEQGDRGNSPAPNLDVFRIENEELLRVLGLKSRPGSWRYSFADIFPSMRKLNEESDRIKQIDPKKRTLYEAKVMELGHHVDLWLKLVQGQEPRIIPTGKGDEHWLTYAEVRAHCDRIAQQGIESDAEMSKLEPAEKDRRSRMLSKHIMSRSYPAADAWSRMISAYHRNNPKDFDKAVSDFKKAQGTLPDDAAQTASFEVFFNSFSPFHLSYGFYVIGFLLICGGWIAYPHILIRSALWLTLLTLVVHGFALLSRMYIQGRPPVTNLYSSAVFIGWGGAALGLYLERIFRNGIGVAVACVIGAATSIIANYLADTKGDTLEMMQAVLDTNFWLATHVTCITLGYSATIVAGLLGLSFILLGVFTTRLDQTWFRSLSQMTYGVLCFATLLSFVGTVLGGIWADQSWGRFWGWDPKENGALLIVLINALALHARWSGLVKQRGFAVLTLVGNMITGWSWFGTNQLGVGLHAYGFNDTLATGLTIFWASHLVFIGIGMIPTESWSSFGKAKTAEAT